MTLASALLLAGLSLGTTTTGFGLSRADTFRTEAESVDGLRTIAASFPAGVVSPVVVLTTPAAADAVAATAKGVEGVSDVRPGERTADLAELNVVITAEPDTAASYDTIRALRTAVAADDPDAVVGGSVAAGLDARDASVRDLQVISPLILAVVLGVLIVLLRALVAPLVLIATVILSFFAALGAGSLLFSYVFGFPALDYSVPLLSFLFLVALGVDYNIFLVSRAREETERLGRDSRTLVQSERRPGRDGQGGGGRSGVLQTTSPSPPMGSRSPRRSGFGRYDQITRKGVLEALAVTGGVITSAGILLAAVFTVLGVLPVIALTETGVIVGVGVLLDTLLVRTVLVPALVTLIGNRFWWPGRLARAAPSPSFPSLSGNRSVATPRRAQRPPELTGFADEEEAAADRLAQGR